MYNQAADMSYSAQPDAQSTEGIKDLQARPPNRAIESSAPAAPAPTPAPKAVPPELAQQHAQLVHRYGEISLALEELGTAKTEVVEALRALVAKIKAIL